jgi:hypothetical protein
MAEPYDWKQAFSAWERAVGAPLEKLVQTEGFADALATFVKGQSVVRRDAGQLLEKWLHVLRLPAASDVQSLQEQVRALEQEVRSLRRELRRASVAQIATVPPPAPIEES